MPARSLFVLVQKPSDIEKVADTRQNELRRKHQKSPHIATFGQLGALGASMWGISGLEDANGTKKSPKFFEHIQNMMLVLAWVYKSSVGLQVYRGSASRAWDYKSSVGLQVQGGTTRQAPEKQTSTQH